MADPKRNERNETERVAWHTRSADEAVREFETDIEQGLSTNEAEERLERLGPNAIRRDEGEPAWKILLGQFTDPLIYILLIAVVVSFAFQELVDAAVILVVVVINAGIGFSQEWRARRAIQSLQEMTARRRRWCATGSPRRSRPMRWCPATS